MKRPLFVFFATIFSFNCNSLSAASADSESLSAVEAIPCMEKPSDSPYQQLDAMKAQVIYAEIQGVRHQICQDMTDLLATGRLSINRVARQLSSALPSVQIYKFSANPHHLKKEETMKAMITSAHYGKQKVLGHLQKIITENKDTSLKVHQHALYALAWRTLHLDKAKFEAPSWFHSDLVGRVNNSYFTKEISTLLKGTLESMDKADKAIQSPASTADKAVLDKVIAEAQKPKGSLTSLDPDLIEPLYRRMISDQMNSASPSSPQKSFGPRQTQHKTTAKKIFDSVVSPSNFLKLKNGGKISFLQSAGHKEWDERLGLNPIHFHKVAGHFIPAAHFFLKEGKRLEHYTPKKGAGLTLRTPPKVAGPAPIAAPLKAQTAASSSSPHSGMPIKGSVIDKALQLTNITTGQIDEGRPPRRKLPSNLTSTNIPLIQFLIPGAMPPRNNEAPRREESSSLPHSMPHPHTPGADDPLSDASRDKLRAMQKELNQRLGNPHPKAAKDTPSEIKKLDHQTHKGRAKGKKRPPTPKRIYRSHTSKTGSKIGSMIKSPSGKKMPLPGKEAASSEAEDLHKPKRLVNDLYPF